MQLIDTGYKPEFGLGAYFAGQNAANAEDLNREELIKNYIANQQARENLNQSGQMNPLLIAEQRNKNTIGDYDAALATEKNLSPTYKKMLLAGTEGQMQSQINAAEKGKALLPFQIAAEQAAAETEKNRQNVLWTMQNIDRQLADGGGTDASGNIVPFTPGQIGFMKQKRDELTKQLETTPEWKGKFDLQAEELASRERIAAMNAAAMNERAAASAQRAPKLPTTAEAAMTQQIIGNEYMDDNEKHKLLQEIFNAKQINKNATGEDLALIQDPATGKIKLAPRAVNAPVSQTIPTNTKTTQQEAPQTQESWNNAWSKLSKGQTMMGLDGKTYTKK